MTAWILAHQLGIVAAAGILAILGLVLLVLDARQAERQASERAAQYDAVLTPDEIEEILSDRRPS